MRNVFKVRSGEADVGAIVAMVVTAAATIIIGFLMLTTIETNQSVDMSTSVLSASKDVVLGGYGNAAGMLAVGIVVIALMMIVGIVMSLNRGEE